MADGHDHLPRGTIEISAARELLASGSVNAAYEPDGSVADDTLKRPMLAFGYGRVPERPPAGDLAGVHEEEVIWGGELVNQFGHFLVESVTRLWPLVPGGGHEGLPVVFKGTPVASFAGEWLESFGVETILLPPEGSVRFRRMLVPEQAWRLGAWIAPEMRDVHLHARRGLAVPAVPHRDVLWLSRSRLRRERVAYDECLLEWILGEHVTPVKLETMPLAEQIGALESSRVVAGVMGSAFHALLLTADTPDCVYLCPSFAKGPYTAQHSLLDGNATFTQTVVPAARVRRLRRDGFYFPGGHRVLIPEALAALGETAIPSLLEDARVAAFAHPERSRQHGGPTSEIDAAAIRVLREPFSVEARSRLGSMFEERGLSGCAAEQLGMVADLTGTG